MSDPCGMSDVAARLVAAAAEELSRRRCPRCGKQWVQKLPYFEGDELADEPCPNCGAKSERSRE